MGWGALFDRADAFGVDEDAVRETLAARRAADGGGDVDGDPEADPS